MSSCSTPARSMSRHQSSCFCLRHRCECLHTCGNFYARTYTRSEKPQQLGRARSVLLTSHAQRAGPNLSGQHCCKLRLELARRKLFVEFVTATTLVCKNCHSLVEPPFRLFYTVSVSACLFVDERSAFLRAPVRIALTTDIFVGRCLHC